MSALRSKIAFGKSTGQSLRRPWKNCFSIGRGYELLRADVLEHVSMAKKALDFRYLRFHGIFHDDVGVVHRDPQGKLRFSWHQLDKIYDALLERGIRPFVELNSMPADMASGSETMFAWKMNITPPRDYDEWEQLITAFTEHVVERYGLDEVRSWYFEVWNEPNLSAFWSGDQEQYFELYRRAAIAIKRVDSRLRVGGPASSKASWISEIIEYCQNADVPLDFVSTHLYPQDEWVTYEDLKGSPHAPGEFFSDTVRAVQKTVKESVRPDLEIHWTEWNTLSTDSSAGVDWLSNEAVDSAFAAPLLAKEAVNLDSAADSLCYWVISDLFEESGTPQAPFSSTYGMVSIHGVPKASFRAFEMLARLNGEVLESKLSGDTPPQSIVQAVQHGRHRACLLGYHQRLEQKDAADWETTLDVSGESAAATVVRVARIRPGAGSAYEVWRGWGRPQNLTRAQVEHLQSCSHPESHVEVLPSGQESFTLQVKANELVLVEWGPHDGPAIPKRADSTAAEDWNVGMTEASR